MDALILDDEIDSIDTISLILEKKFNGLINIVAKCTNITDALRCMDLYHPEVVFLDIEVPNGTGFDFLANVQNHNFNVIFITAHESYALRAIKFNAIDYLLKPVNPIELEEAIKKIVRKKENDNLNSLPEIKNLLDNLKNLKNDLKKIAIIGAKTTSFVEVREIVHCEYHEFYTTVHLIDSQKQHCAKTMKDFEEMLSEFNFMRVSPSSLINLTHVKTYIGGGGVSYAIMTDGSKIEISRRRRAEFLARISSL